LYGTNSLVLEPAMGSISRLKQLVEAQDAYDKEHKAGCGIAKTGTEDGAIGKDQEHEAEGAAQYGGGHDAQPGVVVIAPCESDAAAIANRIALEAVRGSTATVHFTFLAAVIAIGALMGALWSAVYARRSWLVDRDARRGVSGSRTSFGQRRP
jgi:hypothetical protein